MSRGYVYAMINASIPGLVKVGSTSRTLDDRVRELSAATGVPTPFVVAYSEEFDDCACGEAETHRILEKGGYRLTQNREFFHAPLEDVIRAILAARQSLLELNNAALPSTAKVETAEPAKLSICQQLLTEAANHDSGFGCPPDAKVALRKYLKAHKLGCKGTCRILATMYFQGRGCRRDLEKARWFATEGLLEGHLSLHVLLVDIAMEEGLHIVAAGHYDNYFAAVERAGDWSQDDYRLAVRCLRESYQFGIPLRCRERLRPVAAEVLREFGGRMLQSRDARYARIEAMWNLLIMKVVAELSARPEPSDESTGFNVDEYWRKNYVTADQLKPPSFEEFVRLALGID